MDVYANLKAGGYTWARYGFTATKDEVRNVLTQKRLESIDYEDIKAAKSIVDDFYKHNAADVLFPMNLLTGKSWSKKLLEESGWKGFLDLKDKSQRDVFENYIEW